MPLAAYGNMTDFGLAGGRNESSSVMLFRNFMTFRGVYLPFMVHSLKVPLSSRSVGVGCLCVG